jgi:hypothetical protein
MADHALTLERKCGYTSGSYAAAAQRSTTHIRYRHHPRMASAADPDLSQCAGSLAVDKVADIRVDSMRAGSRWTRTASLCVSASNSSLPIIGAAFSGSGRITPSSALADLLGGLPRFQLSEGMADRRVRQQNAALF